MSQPARKYTRPMEQGPKLKMIQGNYDPERYKRSDAIIGGEARVFFGAGYRSVNYGIHIGVFRKGLSVVHFRGDEINKYGRWLSASVDKDYLFNSAICLPELTAVELEELKSRDDPAIHVRNTLESIRERDYPSLERDQTAYAKVQGAYSFILRSIHHASWLP